MLVHHFLEFSAASYPDKVAIVCDGERLTYRQIDEAATRLAAYLTGLGLQRQDRVVIFLENSVESVISLFGILKAGGVFVLLNPGMKAHKLGYILRDSGARAVITHAAKLPVLSEAASAAGELQHLVVCHAQEKAPQSEWTGRPLETTASWQTLFESPLLCPYPGHRRLIDVDLATIIYTSGSTGEPKGVVSAHYNVVAAARSITTYLENQPSDIILSALPLSFDYGLYQVLMAFLFGGTVVIEKSFTYPYRTLELLVREKVTGFPIVPTMLAILLQMDNLAAFDFSSLRYMTNTGAALPVAYIKKLQEKISTVKIFSMYGLTECKRVSYLPCHEIDRKPQSVGIPIPNEDVFVVNAAGEEVGPDQVGELVVRGSNVMQGYWNAPEETARVFRPGRHRGESLLYTGDLFRKDDEGFLYFVARKDDMIKTKGERVSPKEIENALCEIPDVAEAAVLGVPDDILGQAIKAFIVRKKGGEVEASAIQKYCMKNLESFMVPKHVEFLEAMPKSGSGKIDKKALKEL